VGDGAGEHGHVPSPTPRKKIGKIFFGILSSKIRAFSGKYQVKFGHFVSFSYIIFGQKCLAPKVD